MIPQPRLAPHMSTRFTPQPGDEQQARDSRNNGCRPSVRHGLLARFVWKGNENQSRGGTSAPLPQNPPLLAGVHRLCSLLRARKAVKHEDPRKIEMLTSVPHPANARAAPRRNSDPTDRVGRSSPPRLNLHDLPPCRINNPENRGAYAEPGLESGLSRIPFGPV